MDQGIKREVFTHEGIEYKVLRFSYANGIIGYEVYTVDFNIFIGFGQYNLNAYTGTIEVFNGPSIVFKDTGSAYFKGGKEFILASIVTKYLENCPDCVQNGVDSPT